jgi:hypothetical protein
LIYSCPKISYSGVGGVEVAGGGLLGVGVDAAGGFGVCDDVLSCGWDVDGTLDGLLVVPVVLLGLLFVGVLSVVGVCDCVSDSSGADGSAVMSGVDVSGMLVTVAEFSTISSSPGFVFSIVSVSCPQAVSKSIPHIRIIGKSLLSTILTFL